AHRLRADVPGSRAGAMGGPGCAQRSAYLSLRLVYLGHEPPLKADLSARENLRYWIGVRHRFGAAALEDALERVGASPWCERLVRTLSAGQRRRVALAGLALSMVPLWLLDEPTTNLDTEGQQ